MKDSRQRLIDTAKYLFARDGYDATSTRAIVNKANINISSIAYYFGGKEGLYQEVLKGIVSTIQDAMSETITEVNKLLSKEDISSNEAESALYSLVSKICLLMCSDEMDSSDVNLFWQEYSAQGEAFALICRELIDPTHSLIIKLLIKASGDKIDSETAHLYTFQLFFQMFVFKARKNSVLRRMNWTRYGEKELNRIVHAVIEQLRGILLLQKD